MKKIAILGCENSHASSFLSAIAKYEEFSDVEVVGVYSDEREAAEKLRERYGTPVMENYSDAVGKIDGLVIVARNGDNHLKYARPYLDSGIPMYIDKPITNSEQDAITLVRELESRKIRYTGGSCLRHDVDVKSLGVENRESVDGLTVGGTVRAPLDSNSPYGGFFFYAPHLVETVMEIFGKYPKSVMAYKNGIKTTVIFRYEDYDITGLFVENNYYYFAERQTEKGSKGMKLYSREGNDWIWSEFSEYYKLLSGGDQVIAPSDFIAPVFVMNAIKRSIDSGKEEKVNAISI